jgi:RNA polymerase sigma-70 factor, ECF subfamily
MLMHAQRGARLPGRGEEHPVMSVESLYRQHGSQVLRWAELLLGPGGDAGDVAHDVFIVVQRKLPGWKAEAPVTTWLYAITVRVAQQHRRRSRRWGWFRARTGSAGERADCLALLHASRSEGGPDPHADLEGRQAAEALYQVLGALPEKHRTALILYELDRLSAEQIAAVTETTVANVWARISRGRREFVRRYQQREQEGSAR